MPVRKRIHDITAYQLSVRRYMADTKEGKAIREFLLGHFKLVDKAKRLYFYDKGGLFGHLAARVDMNGRIVFAVYPKEPRVTGLQFRRLKDRYRTAQRPIFLTAPEVWAHIKGRQGPLRRDAYKNWMASLENEALAEAVDTFGARYWPPDLLNPDSLEKKEDPSWEEKRRDLEMRLGKRLTLPYWRLMYKVYEFFLKRWADTALLHPQKLPRAIKAADGYLGQRFKVTRFAIRRVILDLDRAGFIQAIMYKPFPGRKKRGIYCYIPGTGKPPPSPTRRPGITDQETLIRFFRFADACASAWKERFLVRKMRKGLKIRHR